MMLLVWLGALLIISGIVLTATRTIQFGRLSDARRPPAMAAPDTLEPKDRGRRLSIKADLPGLALIAVGSLLLLAVAL
jgi:hypothetical protein